MKSENIALFTYISGNNGMIHFAIKPPLLQSGKLLERTYHRRSTYRYAEALIFFIYFIY